MIGRLALVVSVALLIGCSIGRTADTPDKVPTQVPTSSPSPIRATVSDLSVPFAASEAEALAPQKFMASGSFGRLGMGCLVEVVKTTDRAAQVKFVSCPDYAIDTLTPKVPIIGWVAKSALNLH